MYSAWPPMQVFQRCQPSKKISIRCFISVFVLTPARLQRGVTCGAVGQGGVSVQGCPGSCPLPEKGQAPRVASRGSVTDRTGMQVFCLAVSLEQPKYLRLPAAYIQENVWLCFMVTWWTYPLWIKYIYNSISLWQWVHSLLRLWMD